MVDMLTTTRVTHNERNDLTTAISQVNIWTVDSLHAIRVVDGVEGHPRAKHVHIIERYNSTDIYIPKGEKKVRVDQEIARHFRAQFRIKDDTHRELFDTIIRENLEDVPSVLQDFDLDYGDNIEVANQVSAVKLSTGFRSNGTTSNGSSSNGSTTGSSVQNEAHSLVRVTSSAFQRPQIQGSLPIFRLTSTGNGSQPRSLEIWERIGIEGEKYVSLLVVLFCMGIGS
jgi:hypothetical protein